MPWYAPLNGRLLAVKITFLLLAGLGALAIVSDVVQIVLVANAASMSDDTLMANDIWQAGLGMLKWLGIVAGAIVFLMWLSRAFRNTDVVAPGVRRYGHGWEIGSWFIPIFNLFRPVQIVNDVFRAGSGGGAAGASVLTMWWMAWITWGVIARLAGLTIASGDEIGEIVFGASLVLAADVLYALAAIFAFVVARKATRLLDEQARIVAWRPPSGPRVDRERWPEPAPVASGGSHPSYPG